MIDLPAWMPRFLDTLTKTFGDRVWFVGLQGSYARGEATETSDIDLVVILDSLSAQDVQIYHDMLDTIPYRGLVCGFLSGRDEILHWEPSDLFQFYHDTKPVRGSLDALLPLIDAAAVDRAVRIGACNVYHGCVHNMLYEKDDNMLRGLYKSASFVIQAVCFRQTGRYVTRQSDMLPLLDEQEQAIIRTFLHLKQGGTADFRAMSEALLAWSSRWIRQLP